MNAEQQKFKATAEKLLLEEDTKTGRDKMPDFTPREYRIDQENERAMNIGIAYFSGNGARLIGLTEPGQPKLELHKSFNLAGNPGSGKSFMMAVFQRMTETIPEYMPRSFITVDCDFIVDKWEKEGAAGIELYKNKTRRDPINVKRGMNENIDLNLDELGHERIAKFNVNVIESIILSKYKLWLKHGLKLHGTTNLTYRDTVMEDRIIPAELKRFYGDRAYSRYMQMTNFVILGSGDSIDRRLHA